MIRLIRSRRYRPTVGLRRPWDTPAAGAAVALGALLLLAGCTTDDAEGDDGPVNPPPDGAALVSTEDVADIVAGQLREQVGGSWTVDCPSPQAAVTGATFACSAAGPDDLSAVVSITLTDDAGGFEWQTVEQSGGAPLG